MPKNFESDLEEIETLIKSARGDEAQKHLQILRKRFKLDGFEVRVAALARRAYLADLGLRILHPIVRPSGRKTKVAGTKEYIEYAACLIRAGAVEEADEILSMETVQADPQAPFLRAAVFIKKWDYEKAAPLLHQYISSPGLSRYSLLIGKLNLGFVFTYLSELAKAKSLLLEVIDSSSPKEEKLLHSNALRLLGNLEMARRDWDSAIDYFKHSARLLGEFPSLDLFFCRKWLSVCEYMKSPENLRIKTAFENIKKEAAHLGHWESVRDMDLHKAIAIKDDFLFTHLYFGTPMEGFRERIKVFWKPVAFPSVYFWRVGSGKSEPLSFDLRSAPLKAGQAMQRMMQVLISDFYRPFSKLELYEKVFPTEHYAPGVSELRVHQTIFRLRDWFQKEKLPLEIREEKGEYRLCGKNTVDIKCDLIPLEADPEMQRLSFLRAKLGITFSASAAASLLDLSRRATSEILLSAVQSGLLHREGKGRNTTYQFVEPRGEYKKAG